MTITVTASSLEIGSHERIALARAIAGLIGKIARMSEVHRIAGDMINRNAATDYLSMARPGPYDMSAAGVIIELHDSCFTPDRATQVQVRELATPFGRWRVCPGIHNGGGEVFAPISQLDELLQECGAVDMDPRDYLGRRQSEYTQVKVLQRIGDIELPPAVGVKNEYGIPGYSGRHSTAMKREWTEQIAPYLTDWYAAA